MQLLLHRYVVWIPYNFYHLSQAINQRSHFRNTVCRVCVIPGGWYRSCIQNRVGPRAIYSTRMCRHLHFCIQYRVGPNATSSTMCVNTFTSLRTKENSMIPTVKLFLCQCCIAAMVELTLTSGNFKRKTDVYLEPRVVLDNI